MAASTTDPTTDPTTGASIRTSRKEQTRRRLQQEALRLFTERGFHEVTVEDIAAAAGVSHMTFFRNFPTKESVVLDDPYDPLIAEAVAAQDPELPALERVRLALLAAWSAVEEPAGEETRLRVRLAATTPSLRAGMWENNHRTEDIVVDALTSSGSDPFEARVATGAALGAITAALLHWATNQSSSLGDTVRGALALLAPAPSPDPADG